MIRHPDPPSQYDPHSRHPPPRLSPSRRAPGLSLAVRSTISHHDVKQALSAYKVLVKASREYRRLLGKMAATNARFAEALHGLSATRAVHPVAAVGMRKYAELHDSVAVSQEELCQIIKTSFEDPLRANYAAHKVAISINARKFHQAESTAATAIKTLEKRTLTRSSVNVYGFPRSKTKSAVARTVGGYRSDFVWSSTHSPGIQKGSQRRFFQDEYHEGLRQLGKAASSLELLRNENADVVISEEHRNSLFVAQKCADAMTIEGEFHFRKLSLACSDKLRELEWLLDVRRETANEDSYSGSLVRSRSAGVVMPGTRERCGSRTGRARVSGDGHRATPRSQLGRPRQTDMDLLPPTFDGEGFKTGVMRLSSSSRPRRPGSLHPSAPWSAGQARVAVKKSGREPAILSAQGPDASGSIYPVFPSFPLGEADMDTTKASTDSEDRDPHLFDMSQQSLWQEQPRDLHPPPGWRASLSRHPRPSRSARQLSLGLTERKELLGSLARPRSGCPADAALDVVLQPLAAETGVNVAEDPSQDLPPQYPIRTYTAYTPSTLRAPSPCSHISRNQGQRSARTASSETSPNTGGGASGKGKEGWEARESDGHRREQRGGGIEGDKRRHARPAPLTQEEHYQDGTKGSGSSLTSAHMLLGSLCAVADD